MEIIEKAYAITADIEEPWFSDMPYIRHGTKGKVKSDCLYEFSECKLTGISKHYRNIDLDHEINEVGFLDLKCVRAKEFDYVLFRGKKTTRQRVYELIKQDENNKELDNILLRNPNELAYIYKGVRGGYYGSNYCGYFTDKINAGIYSIQDAVNECRNMSTCDGFKIVIVNKEERNKEINRRINIHIKDIENLKSKLL